MAKHPQRYDHNRVAAFGDCVDDDNLSCFIPHLGWF